MANPPSTSEFLERVVLTLHIKKLLAFCIFLVAISIPSAVLLFNRVMLAGHSTVFSPSDPRLGFQNGPASRGTLNLIWACFSTIFTCIYVSLHLDVPSQPIKQKPPKTFCYSVKKPWHWVKNLVITRKVIWMGVNLVVPEVLAGVALWEYRSARAGVTYMTTKGHEGWTLTHAFFADMGGFKVQDDSFPDGRVLLSGAEFYQWFSKLKGNEESINFEQLLLDIDDRSKADSLLKTITCLQASWLVVQTVVRACEKRPVSELELTTCAYVLCTLVTYLFWWYKPYNVRQHIWVHVVPPAENAAHHSPTSFDRLHAAEPITLPEKEPTTPPQKEPTTLPEQVDPNSRWPFNRSCSINDVKLVFVVSGLVGADIGVIHCGLWDALFINSNGRLLWRICCGLQIAAPLIEAMSPLLPKASWHVHLITLIVVGIAYCFARVIIVLLIITSFRSLPAGIYSDIDWTWTAFPHWH